MRRLLCLTLLAALLPATPAAAATFTVATLADGADTTVDGICAGGPQGRCTLRAALSEANGTPEPDVVVLPAGAYQLLNGLGQLSVAKTVTIEGAGARTTTITAPANSRVMIAAANLTLRGVTLTGGNVSSTTSVYGGGLLIAGGDALLEGVTIRGNAITSETNAYGGGIAVLDPGTLRLHDSTVSGNGARGAQTNGKTTSGIGGGIYSSEPLTIARSTIVGNDTLNYGAGGYSTGGGLAIAGATTIDQSTLANNTSVTYAGSSGFRQGGNLYISGAATVKLGGTILAGGTATNGPDCYIANGTVTELRRNLTTTADCLGAGSLRNTDPKLGPLADNGGPTDTLRPPAGSPAVDAGTACGLRPADQRGNALPAGPACDLGAVEIGAERAVTVQSAKAAAAAGEDVVVSATIANAGLDDASDETLTLDLPAGTTATTVTTTLGSCTTGPQVVCALGTLGRAAKATVIATVRASGVSGTITARRGGSLPDQSGATDQASVAVAWAGAPAGGGAGTGGAAVPGAGAGTGTPDRIAPVISGLKVSARRGATLRFRLSEAASVRIVTERVVRRRGARTRYVRVVTTTAQRAAGAVTVKLPAKALRRGRMRFTVVATDAAGNVSATRRVLARVSR